MGERHSGNGLPGRRHGHPGGTVLGPGPDGQDAGFEARFAAALRRDGMADGVDPEAAQRAVAAFRVARDSGAHRARTRRRDDWRPRKPRRARFSVKTTLSVFLASIALGGVAVAAIGSAGHQGGGDGRRAQPSASTPQRSAAQPGVTAPGAAPAARPDHPATAKDTLAHCRAYEQVQGRGKALDATAWQRLVTAAGGEKKVAAYCAAQLPQTGGQKTDKPAKSNNGGKTDKGAKTGKGAAPDSPKTGGKN
ncbi:hypothetical protein AQI88_22610 [Streptomyces cellostaticus]|uniref:Uncharacterized protein n=1 Tax=Streptomyces cellostaticus TaxID=67285 RepID=A0A101NJR1_9ACTN|nr:hypothetical protein [Streptomyces cellostaticus]KUM94171.1 hypothetical protein AQI88_22610 [Streptomyces cellostaticus]GHI05446.1 hypothetical protein Scel_37670 [Streptomyces cellostaticus]